MTAEDRLKALRQIAGETAAERIVRAMIDEPNREYGQIADRAKLLRREDADLKQHEAMNRARVEFVARILDEFARAVPFARVPDVSLHIAARKYVEAMARYENATVMAAQHPSDANWTKYDRAYEEVLLWLEFMRTALKTTGKGAKHDGD